MTNRGAHGGVGVTRGVAHLEQRAFGLVARLSQQRILLRAQEALRSHCKHPLRLLRVRWPARLEPNALPGVSVSYMRTSQHTRKTLLTHTVVIVVRISNLGDQVYGFLGPNRHSKPPKPSSLPLSAANFQFDCLYDCLFYR